MFLFDIGTHSTHPYIYRHHIHPLYSSSVSQCAVDGMEHTALGKSKNGSLLSASYNIIVHKSNSLADNRGGAATTQKYTASGLWIAVLPDFVLFRTTRGSSCEAFA